MALTLLELNRDEAVRTLPCRVCQAQPPDHCTGRRRGRWPDKYQLELSHTGRYNDAVARGLVPPLGRSARAQ